MIQATEFLESLRSNGVSFFAGVPDSLLKDFCACVMETVESSHHVIAANEGGAVALAVGHYLATGTVPLVYMQNSGLGNATNPILSLADKEVYGIPMVLLVGWRGEPGVKDEPQHVKQGRVQPALLRAMELESVIIDRNTDSVPHVVADMVGKAKALANPVVIVVRAGTFAPYAPCSRVATPYELSRERAIEIVLSSISPETIVVSTTGMASREVFEFRAREHRPHSRDFLTVGSMGHSVMIALGVALSRPELRVLCLDGDGAVLMHMGALPILGSTGPSNLLHVVLNNQAHDSVGGQPTAAGSVDFPVVARACSYAFATSVSTEAALRQALVEGSVAREGPVLIEVKIKRGARADLGRPTSTPTQNRDQLMAGLAK